MPEKWYLPHAFRQLSHCNKHFKCWLNKINQIFKYLSQLIDINALNVLSVKRHLSGLNFRPATLKSHASNFKIADYLFKRRGTMFSAVWCLLDCLQAQHSIVQLFIWNEQWWRNIAAHLSIGQNVNDWQKLIGFVEFFYQYPWMISVGMLVTSVVERCYRLGINYLISLQKMQFI